LRQKIWLGLEGGMASFPNWQDEIGALFAEPYWINPVDRKRTGQGWTRCMNGFDLQLDRYDSVKASSVLIYEVLSSRMMPLGEASWPNEPLETFRQWVNLGWPETPVSPIDEKERIAPVRASRGHSPAPGHSLPVPGRA
jgi:hypothetical protein